MNNITVERVLRAYDAWVVTPGFMDWGNVEKQCGCGLTALVMYENPEAYPTLQDVLDNLDSCGERDVCKTANVTWAYMLGFTDAFDGVVYGTSAKTGSEELWIMRLAAEYDMGFDHGKAAREAVLNKYFPNGYVLTEGAEN